MSAPAMLRIAILNVGQGDCIVVFDSEKTSVLVIDCGDGSILLDFLETEGISQVDLALVTHNDEDHVAGIAELVQKVPVRQVAIHPAVVNSRGAVKRQINLLLDAVGATGREVAGVNTHCRLLGTALDDLCFSAELLYPTYHQALQGPRPNSTSAVVRISLGDSVAIFTGDLDRAGWDRVMSSASACEKLRGQLLKFPHHGGKLVADAERHEADAYAERILETVQPSLTVVSVGTDNSYEHPNASVMKAIRNYGTRKNQRMLCTEVTPLCDIDYNHHRDQVLALLPSVHHSARTVRGEGCPCAGSVYLQMGPNGAVCTPEGTIHQQIVSMYQIPQCISL